MMTEVRSPPTSAGGLYSVNRSLLVHVDAHVVLLLYLLSRYLNGGIPIAPAGVRNATPSTSLLSVRSLLCCSLNHTTVRTTEGLGNSLLCRRDTMPHLSQSVPRQSINRETVDTHGRSTRGPTVLKIVHDSWAPLSWSGQSRVCPRFRNTTVLYSDI